MGGRDLNAYNFIIAIITGRSLNWSLTLIYVFKLVLKNGFNLLFCCLPSEEAVVMSAWWGVDRLGYLPERLNRSSFIGLCSHTFSVKFSAGWHWKAFAGSPGSLSAYLLSKLVAAPELKRSEKEEEEEEKRMRRHWCQATWCLERWAQRYSRLWTWIAITCSQID